MALGVQYIHPRPCNFFTRNAHDGLQNTRARIFCTRTRKNNIPTTISIKGGAIPCDQYATAGATPAQWCEPWGGECPLGRRVIPSRRADPVMIRPVIRQKSQTGNTIKKDNSLLMYIVLALLVLFFIRLM